MKQQKPYQVLARKYRPQTFAEVLNQEAIVSTLKNAIRRQRLAQAYLFCGSRGTGKTTLARILAKALNCQNLTAECEPCNTCTSCKEISSGHSLDVLEIDGASNRGIDDIRQINETVGYSTSSGGYKIYIIDEVHMLTKEAFNALLKTLEEPPPKVKFLFATTEAHKVLPTILSRCQRFNLRRISSEQIQAKLKKIAQDEQIRVDDEALRLIASCADGGLRDAESLFDQIIAFHDGDITSSTVASMLGIMERDFFFKLDEAGQHGNLAVAFEISEEVFSSGKDLVHFVENLAEHFRHILVVKVAGKQASYLHLSEEERNRYEVSAKLYSQEVCLMILDFLVEAQSQIKFAPSPKTALEALLLRVIRSQSRIPIDILVRRLADLEKKISLPDTQHPESQEVVKSPSPLPKAPTAQTKMPEYSSGAITDTKTKPQEVIKSSPKTSMPQTKIPEYSLGTISEDPTPSKADLGIKEKPSQVIPPPIQVEKAVKETAFKPTQTISPPVQAVIDPNKQSRYDTVLQFAAIELEGIIQKKQSS